MLQVSVDLSGWQRLMAAIWQLRSPEAMIWNPVHYVKYLEHGSSRQAPHGMARISLKEIGAELGRNIQQIPFQQTLEAAALQGALNGAVDQAAVYGRVLIRSRTPIKTGWARLNWIVTQTSGAETAGSPLGADELAMIAKRGGAPRVFF